MKTNNLKEWFWGKLARLGFWIPIAKYKPIPRKWDWVLVSSIDKQTNLRCLPFIASYIGPGWNIMFEPAPWGFVERTRTFTHWRILPKYRRKHNGSN